MTNVSAVEKMAELMQQMEENSPRVTALQYCLKLVGNKLEEVEKRISELEAKCAALAAENAGLKSEVPLGAIENGRAFAERLETYPFECQGGNLNMCSDWQELRRCFEHLSEWAMHGQKETPATDAFVAEVRASELDSLAGVAETMLVKLSNQSCSSDMHEVVGWKMVLQHAANRAAQLRKGAEL
ncbi:hypothetical protein QBC88_000039 [Citrobacter freundii]